MTVNDSCCPDSGQTLATVNNPEPSKANFVGQNFENGIPLPGGMRYSGEVGPELVANLQQVQTLPNTVSGSTAHGASMWRPVRRGDACEAFQRQGLRLD